MRYYYFLLLFFVFGMPLAYAQIPVTDTASLQESIQHGLQMAKQYDQLKKEYEAITGTRNMGNMSNSAFDQEIRRTLPNDWSKLIEAITSGNTEAMGTATASVLRILEENYKLVSDEDFATLQANQHISKSWERASATTTASMGLAELTYDRSTHRLGTYEDFLIELNNTNDTKASIDLLARINIENGILMNEMLRLQSTLLQLQASHQHQDLTADRRARDNNR